MKKVIVIEENCIACGLCESVCDKVFSVEESAKVIVENVDENLVEDVEIAIEGCPTNAIEWEK